MACSVFLDDYVTHRRLAMLLSDEQFGPMQACWEDESEMLIGLQNLDLFAGYTRLCQLTPNHFRILLTNVLRHITLDAPDGSPVNLQDTIEQPLCFLIIGLVYCLEQRSQVAVDTLNIMRINDIEVSCKVQLSMIPGGAEPQKTKPTLRVIVDNT